MAEEKTRKEDVELKKPDQGSEVVVDEKKAAKAETKKSETKTEEKTSLDSTEKSAEKPVVKKKKKKIRRQVLRGQAHIQCTYNNTLMTFSDLGGKVLAWSSAGSLGFRGAKKATPYAATQIVSAAAEKVAKYGLKEIEVFVKGVGSGREASIRALANNDFEIISIKDITPVPHNGCRPRKPRRV
jgi:small subunit ribosomal protein S11